MTDKKAQQLLSGRVALVTGAARGIGEAVANGFAAAGATVWMGDIDLDEVRRAAAAIPGARAEALDITAPDSVQRLAQHIDTAHGRLDILVNNAAVLDVTPTDQLTTERLLAVYAVNLTGTIRTTLDLLPLIRRSTSGKILNIASVNGLRGVRGSLAYNTAKGGIANFTQSLAAELGAEGINVNAIAPGFIDTRMSFLADGVTKEQTTDWFRTIYIEHGRIPLRRGGVPDDIAGPAVFLCSDDARYITGHILPVDGGMLSTF